MQSYFSFTMLSFSCFLRTCESEAENAVLEEAQSDGTKIMNKYLFHSLRGHQIERLRKRCTHFSLLYFSGGMKLSRFKSIEN